VRAVALPERMRSCTVTVPYNASSAAPYPLLKIIAPHSVRALDGNYAVCSQSAAGVAAYAGCSDLGIGGDTYWRQLNVLPARVPWRHAPAAEARKLADELQAELSRLQDDEGGNCGSRPQFTVGMLPTIGFCATIEYGMLALARAASSGSRLVLGRRSTSTWTSGWLCQRERSLSCYFNVSARCCPDESSFDGAAGGGHFGGKMAKLGVGSMRLKAGKQPAGMTLPGGLAAAGKGGSPSSDLEYGSSRALSLGGALARFNVYGTLWVSGQLVRWLFERMHPHIRAEVDGRSRSVQLLGDGARAPRALHAASAAPSAASSHSSSAPEAPPLCISMHVRRGDSCSLTTRFCPRNFTEAYFGAAATLRARYGINSLVVATDDANAAALCRNGVLGFACRTLHMDRQRFDSRTSIERRVVHHASGLLSGSAVALDALADVQLLASCDAHVLVLRSAVSRLALALSVARKGRHPPLISLQWPWGGLPNPARANSQAHKRRALKFKGAPFG
jgi:hypothetical protein